MQPNLFFSVLISLGLGFALGALAFFVILLVSKITARPVLRRFVPVLVALALCLAAFRSSGFLRAFLDRLSYQHDLSKWIVLGLLGAALAVGFRLAYLALRGDRGA